MSVWNSIWGVLGLAVIAAIVFVQAGRLGGESGGSQTSKILTAAGGASSSLISAIETGGNVSGSKVY